eukprot:g5944.t1
MGAGVSAPTFAPTPGVQGQTAEDLKRLAPLNLDEKIMNKFYGVFTRVSASKHDPELSLKLVDERREALKRVQDHLIPIDVFFHALKLESTAFSVRVFSMLDEDDSWTIDFTEFIINLYELCTLSHNGLIMFAFRLYDLDDTLTLSKDECLMMVRDIWSNGGTEQENERCRKLIESMDSDGSGHVSLAEFVSYVKAHPVL